MLFSEQGEEDQAWGSEGHGDLCRSVRGEEEEQGNSIPPNAERRHAHAATNPQKK